MAGDQGDAVYYIVKTSSFHVDFTVLSYCAKPRIS